MDSEKEKNRLSDIVLERVGLTGNLLSAPVSPSPEPAVDMPGHERQVRAGKVTAPEEYKRRFLVPAPKSVEWKTAYIDGNNIVIPHSTQPVRHPAKISHLITMQRIAECSRKLAHFIEHESFEFHPFFRPDA